MAECSLTTKVALFVLDYTYPPVDYEVVHILDTDGVLGYGGGDEGATFCAAYPEADPDGGFSGSDVEIAPGDAICRKCVQAALELRERSSIDLDATYWEPFVWDQEAECWVVGQIKSAPVSATPQHQQVRGRRLGGVAED